MPDITKTPPASAVRRYAVAKYGDPETAPYGRDGETGVPLAFNKPSGTELALHSHAQSPAARLSRALASISLSRFS